MLELEYELALKRKGEISGGIVDWRFQYPFIFEAIQIPEGRILDVGSYDARFARWLKFNCKKRDVVSLDARAVVAPGEKLVRASAKFLPFAENTFDASVSFFAVPILLGKNVLEKDAIQEMIRVSKDRVIIWPIPGWWMENALFEPNPQQDEIIYEYARRIVQNDKMEVQIVNIENKNSHWMNKILVVNI